jgi:mRNA interferase RelE/StbE
MPRYRVVVKPSVEKDLRSIPGAVVERVLVAIDGLQSEPFPRDSMKLSGTEGLHRIRVGQYRVIYAVDRSARLITVHYVRHRREAYRLLS